MKRAHEAAADILRAHWPVSSPETVARMFHDLEEGVRLETLTRVAEALQNVGERTACALVTRLVKTQLEAERARIDAMRAAQGAPS